MRIVFNNSSATAVRNLLILRGLFEPLFQLGARLEAISFVLQDEHRDLLAQLANLFLERHEALVVLCGSAKDKRHLLLMPSEDRDDRDGKKDHSDAGGREIARKHYDCSNLWAIEGGVADEAGSEVEESPSTRRVSAATCSRSRRISSRS